MFYYISFLRPPPLQALPSSPIIIIPQIANDLRTELFGDSQDIFYSWSHVAARGNPTDPTKPVKLTTWKQANAYKEVTVPSPPGVQNGQSWRLILSATKSQRISIDLKEGGADFQLGRTPFPVESMPIDFMKNVSKDCGKQEKIERRYHLIAPDVQSSDPHSSRIDLILRVIEQTSFDLDKKIWDSGIGLSSWLVSLAGTIDIISQKNESIAAQLGKVLFSPAARRIVELGAGTGIVALTLGALRSMFIADEEVDDGCLITTDLPSALPLLEHNVSLNSHLFTRRTVRPKPEVLDWDAELPPYTQALRGQLDAIVMADVTYNSASFPALIRTLSSLIRLSTNDKPPLILLGYKERDVAERSLWTMAEQVGIHFERVGERTGAGGAPVEVWIGQVKV